MDLILASTSRYRKALLERLGLPFHSIDPGVDEASFHSPRFDPRALAESLALAKARAVADREPGSVVIGGDQVVSLDGKILGKPGTVEAAVEQLLKLSGRSHELLTAVAVVGGSNITTWVDITRLTVRSLTRIECERYVLADLPTDCAGSYKLESRGIVLFESIESADHTAIVGLPLIALTTHLRSLGFAIP